MRFRLAAAAMACVMALAVGSALAEDTKKDQPAPGSKQATDQAAKDKAAAEKAAAEKAAADKAAAEKAAPAAADPTKPGEEGQPKAAVNTLEDLFAAYGITAWNAPQPEATPDPEAAVVWKTSTPVANPAPTADPKPVQKKTTTEK